MFGLVSYNFPPVGMVVKIAILNLQIGGFWQRGSEFGGPQLDRSEINFIDGEEQWKTRWWFQLFFIFTPIWGRWSILTNIFQMGWNHQLENVDESFR